MYFLIILKYKAILVFSSIMRLENISFKLRVFSKNHLNTNYDKR